MDVEPTKGNLEAVQGALLLLVLGTVVQGSHAGLEVGALGFDSQSGVTLLFDGLEGMTRHGALLPHDVQLFLELRTLLPP